MPIYPLSENFVKRSRVPRMAAYRALTDRAQADPEQFWPELPQRELFLIQVASKGLEWNPPAARWFSGGTTNGNYNCLDRHSAAGNGAKRFTVLTSLSSKPDDD